jgi:hypothetical protein
MRSWCFAMWQARWHWSARRSERDPRGCAVGLPGDARSAR